MKTSLGLFTTAAISLVALSGANAGEIPVGTVLIKVIEQVEVPAREAGVLSSVAVREGQTVSPGDLLANVDDKSARLEESRAAIELAVATEELNNDINVRFARKSLEVTRSELGRAEASIAEYPKSISATEMDRLTLTVQKAELELEQAEHEHEIAAFNQNLKNNDLQTARQNVARRRIEAPIKGTVVQVYQQPGEWVTPGATVMRIVRMDRLRAEGFLNVQQLRPSLQGASVTLTVDLRGKPAATFPGKLVFVSPEVDPVNRQVRVWAEVENRGLVLRPGLRASMSIQLDGAAETAAK